MKIAITGATGQLGKIVVNKLKEKLASENIVALVRSVQKGNDLGVEVREGDYNNPAALKEALKGVDTLLLISSSEVGQRAVQHRNVIDAAKEAGVTWIVYTSLLHANTSSLSLAGEHLDTEAALLEFAIPFTLLRNGWYHENYTGSIAGALAGGAFLGSAGDGEISSAARADYAEAAVVVLTSKGHEGKVYELAGDEAYNLTGLASEISTQTGRNIPYKNLPEEAYAGVLESFGLPVELSKMIAGWDAVISKGDLFDNSRQLSDLIGRPTTSIKVAVADALNAA